MGAFEARNGRWSLIADLFYADLSQSRSTPLSGTLFASGDRNRSEAAERLRRLSGLRGRPGRRRPSLAGFRVNSVNLDLSLAPACSRGSIFGMSGPGSIR